MKTNEFEPYTGQQYSEQEILERSENFLKWADTRRSVRDFSSKPVPQQVMENIIMTASTAPSGAHKQPWTFCLISNKELKSELRKLAEEEEFKSYNGRMSEEWLKDLAPLGTNWEKEFIDVAPWIVVLMKRIYENDANGEKQNNYYVAESVGIAAGFFLMAVHNAGLVALTHTPNPMNFITKALGRPENERPFLLIPVGFPAEKAQIPSLKRKDSSEVIELYK
ncbi:MAG: nitroreductase family protein [Crocinitomicaceae bacterium]|nr:nitroreductase family protein [Crocinitomicaceae bacterium]MCF8433276.1 nitroreductase family protein [Crocinitomicaceae bacterium]